MKNQKLQKQTGFTMVELVVVLIVVGVLMAMLLPGAKDATNPAKANALLRAADQVNSTIKLIGTKCGTGTTIASNPLPDTGKTMQDVIFGGVANVGAAYKACYGSSQAIALTEVGQPTSTAGVYSVQGYNLSLAGGGVNAVKVGFAGVDDAIGTLMAQNYTPALAALLATADTTSSVIQYDAPSGGLRTMYVLKQ